MPRANLASLLDNAPPAESDTRPAGPAHDDDEPPGDPIGDNQPDQDTPNGRHMASVPHPSGTEAAPTPRPADRNTGQEPPLAAERQAVSALPRYRQLQRKELRIRLDQADDLTRLTRRLNRARRGTGERITDNTLIRVAVDLLLQHSDRLAGGTEEELRKSVTP